MSITIRDATADDYCGIVSLLEERRLWLKERGIVQWGANYTKKYDAEYFCGQQSIGNHLIVVCDGRNLIGCVLLKKEDTLYWGECEKNAYYIHHFATNPGYRGVGNQLLDYIKEYAKTNHIRYIRLDCSRNNEKLVNYYHQQGFKVVKEGADMFYKYNLLEYVSE